MYIIIQRDTQTGKKNHYSSSLGQNVGYQLIFIRHAQTTNTDRFLWTIIDYTRGSGLDGRSIKDPWGTFRVNRLTIQPTQI